MYEHINHNKTWRVRAYRASSGVEWVKSNIENNVIEYSLWIPCALCTLIGKYTWNASSSGAKMVKLF